MKTQFALVLLALATISSLAQAGERQMTPSASEATFNSIKMSAAVTEGKMDGRSLVTIAQGDVMCTRWVDSRLETTHYYRYSCTYFVDDVVSAPKAAPSRTLR